MMGALALSKRDNRVLLACCGPLEAWVNLVKKVEEDGAELDARVLSVGRNPCSSHWWGSRAAVVLLTASDWDEVGSLRYMVMGRTRGLIMVSPAVEEPASQESAKEAATVKERRKLPERRAAAKGPPATK